MNDITFTGIIGWFVGIFFILIVLILGGLFAIEILWKTLAIKSKKNLLKKWDKRNEMVNRDVHTNSSVDGNSNHLRVAVILFAYKRPRTLKRVLKTHYKIDADYFCFIDYSEIQNEIYDIVDSVGLYKIYKRNNSGLTGASKLNSNITTGISKVFGMGYDAAIILEDDILIKDGGLDWLKEQLSIYKQAERIGAVSLCKGKTTDDLKVWGWGIYKNVWQNINWSLDVNGKYRKMWDKTHSWDVYLAYWFELSGLYCRCHPKGLSKHIGYFGTHYHWYSGLSVRKLIAKYHNWKMTKEYYKDKDVIMGKRKWF